MYLIRLNAAVCAAVAVASTVGLNPARPSTAPDQGAADALLDGYVHAIGGVAAIETIQTRVTVYDMSFGWRINGTLEIRQMRPDYIAEQGTASGWGWHGAFSKGFNGTIGWSKAPEERLRALSGDERDGYVRQSRLDRDARLRELYPSRVARSDRAINGRICHVVELASREGSSEVWYLDSRSGLLSQIDTQPDDKNSAALTTTFEDYRQVDAVRVPFRVIRQGAGRRYTMTVRTIRNNVHLAADAFAAPK
jgi:hypothetical protein